MKTQIKIYKDGKLVAIQDVAGWTQNEIEMLEYLQLMQGRTTKTKEVTK